MSDYVSPTVRRRRLSAELRRLRERSGLTNEQVATRLKWSPSKVSRYELARTGLRPADVRRMLTFYQVPAPRQEELLALAREAESKGWWEDYSDVLSEDYIALFGLEAEAVAAMSWHMDVIPGLLQTADYARSLNRKGLDLGPTPPSRLERSVQVRMERQQFLKKDPPLRLTALIDESVLIRKVAGSAIMQAQMEKLADMAELPNVSIRIVPLEKEYRIVIPSFDYLKFGHDRDTSMADVVWTESLQGAIYFDGELDTYPYQVVFDRMTETSLSPAASLARIRQETAGHRP